MLPSRVCRSRSSARGMAVWAALLLVLVCSSCGSAAEHAKYVFLMIGDGMGTPQRNSAEFFLADSPDKNVVENAMLSMNTLPAQGMCTTYCTNSFITDSAAAGTAISTGNKTKSGVISMDTKNGVPYKTIAEMAKEKGMKVGIVSSVSIDHATPAVFYAHEPSRNNYYEIGQWIPKSGFDYFAGGGLKKPNGKDGKQPSVFDALKKDGYTVTTTTAAFKALKPAARQRVVAINPELDASEAMPYAMDRDGLDISLAEFTRKGIELLENPNGFFMMVEGGKIDWACHANDAVASIHDTIAFDKAVQVALDFQKKHPEETLVIVTGDHECGGLTIGFAGTEYDTFFGTMKGQDVSYDVFDSLLAEYKKSHTLQNARFEDMLPLIESHFGMRILSERDISGLKNKASAGDAEAATVLLSGLKPYEVGQLREAFAMSMADQKERAADEETYLLYGGYEPFTIALTHILNHKAGLAWTSYSHTGVPVPVSAIGVYSGSFNGYYDNTDIFSKMAVAMGL
ncbi:MAG: alkaline phosphatase [Thermovirga sp.]